MAARIRNTGGSLKKKRNIKKVNCTKKYIALGKSNSVNREESGESGKTEHKKRRKKKGIRDRDVCG